MGLAGSIGSWSIMGKTVLVKEALSDLHGRTMQARVQTSRNRHEVCTVFVHRDGKYVQLLRLIMASE